MTEEKYNEYELVRGSHWLGSRRAPLGHRITMTATRFKAAHLGDRFELVATDVSRGSESEPVEPVEPSAELTDVVVEADELDGPDEPDDEPDDEPNDDSVNDEDRVAHWGDILGAAKAADARSLMTEEDDPDELGAAIEAERRGSSRVSVLRAATARMDELTADEDE